MAARPTVRAVEIALVAVLASSCNGDRPEPEAQVDRGAVIQGCEEIAKTFERVRCLVEFAAQQGDRGICNESQDEFVSYQCYGLYAQRMDDLDACELIPMDDPELATLRTGCITAIALKRDDVELCESFENQSNRDACHMRFARETGKREYCTKIINETLEQICMTEPQKAQ
ncbi:MAG: hypothetical protein JSU87_05700 [Gemmatimonadota bacterium]|nr:MAG: hypothetical protein JSU87_05700 [Gemmatimonadota bacterium]